MKIACIARLLLGTSKVLVLVWGGEALKSHQPKDYVFLNGLVIAQTKMFDWLRIKHMNQMLFKSQHVSHGKQNQS